MAGREGRNNRSPLASFALAGRRGSQAWGRRRAAASGVDFAGAKCARWCLRPKFRVQPRSACVAPPRRATVKSSRTSLTLVLPYTTTTSSSSQTPSRLVSASNGNAALVNGKIAVPSQGRGEASRRRHISVLHGIIHLDPRSCSPASMEDKRLCLATFI